MLGRYDRISADRARRMAHQVLGNVAGGGGDPANERAEARGMPTLGQAFDEFMAANPNRAPTTDKGYRDFVERYLADWLGRPLDTIARRDVEGPAFKPHLPRKKRLGDGQPHDLAVALGL